MASESSIAAGAASAPDQDEAEKPKPLTLGVVLYPGFELLDVFGPVEMFSNVGSARLKIVMVAEKAGVVASGSMADGPAIPGPKVVADYGFDDAPHLDILLVPGGLGTLRELNNEVLLQWLRKRAAEAQITTSVCSGSAILAKAGLLDGRKATSNKAFFSLATAQSDKTEWIAKARWVDDGDIVTSSGVSAGIDMALALIERLFGTEEAEQIAKGTEYQWHRDPDVDPFAKLLD